MAKFQSPLLGYNNNVRHKGRVFHIQTEDSGVNHPHIITHLFMDGGRILKSVKKSYAEHVGNDKMSETVRVLMKEQHKAMFIALRDGQYDALLEDGKKGSTPSMVAPVPAPALTKTSQASAAEAKPTVEARPAPVVAPAPPAPEIVAASGPTPVAEVKPPPRPVIDVKAPPPNTSPAKVSASAALAAMGPPQALRSVDHERAPSASADGRRPALPRSDPAFVFPDDRDTEVHTIIDDSRPDIESAVEVAPESEPSVPFDDLIGVRESTATLKTIDPRVHVGGEDASPPMARRPPAAELTLDFDALERDGAPSAGSPFLVGDLPPPPRSMFAKEPRTSPYSTTMAAEEDAAARARETPAHASGRGLHVPQASDPPRSAEARYAPARPAAIFGASVRKEHSSAAPSSLFGDELVSDKSLDEVILSYLAEDLDPPRRK